MPHYPPGLPAKYRPHWDAPWQPSKQTVGFRRWLQAHGYLSPHFTLKEAACHDGTPIPRRLRSRARDHAFRLELLRHQLGDVRMTPLSWYRTESYNRAIHGAIHSQHVQAIATDFSREWVESVGRKKVETVASIVFANGGVGTYPAGSMHFDSRGYKARWSSFVGW